MLIGGFTVLELFEKIYEYLRSRKIELFKPISLESCIINKKYLLDRVGIQKGTAVICAVPYFPKECTEPKNISVYASVKNYHSFFEKLFKEMSEYFSSLFPEYKFAGFADHSPIDERDAALRSGLGILGENGLIITEPYSSFVFLGEFITNAEIDCTTAEVKHCIGCGRCRSACPSKQSCLSAITQKKGELTESETELMREYNTAWGCDICQRVCPYTEKALASGSIFSNIDYFTDSVIPELNTEILNALDEKSFEERAFSWRGRNTVLRNLAIMEKKQ